MKERINALVDAIANAPSEDVRHELGKTLLAEIEDSEAWLREQNNVVIVDSTVVLFSAITLLSALGLVGYIVGRF